MTLQATLRPLARALAAAFSRSAFVSAAGLLMCGPALAGAVTDGTVGPVRTFSGQFTVPASVGAVRGSNLFHSFTRFGVSPGESATFLSPDAAMRNVIVRVTGTEASAIDGPVRLSAPSGARPNLWFLNPNGIAVGPQGTFDVPGSLALGAAQTLDFADGSRWSTSATAGGTLSVAEPKSFGFLPQGSTGPLSMQGATVSLNQGGGITLVARDMTLDSSTITTYASKRLSAGDIEITAKGSLKLVGSTIGSYTSGLFDAGFITVTASSLEMRSNATIESRAQKGSEGNSGDITLDVKGGAITMEGARIESGTEGEGAGGFISITATSLDMRASPTGAKATSRITSDAGEDSTAQPGYIDIQVDGTTTLRDGAIISTVNKGKPIPSNDFSYGAVSIQSGSVNLQGGSAITADGQGQAEAGVITLSSKKGPIVIAERSVVSTSSENGAEGGVIQLNAPAVTLTSGGSVKSNSFGDGESGSIRIEVKGGPLNAAGPLKMDGGASIESSTSGSGAGGNITILAASLDMSGEFTSIKSEARDTSSAKAGYVTVNTQGGPVTLREEAVISTTARGEPEPGGKPQRSGVEITAGSLTLDGYSTVQADAYGDANAGVVIVTSSGPIVISGLSSINTEKENGGGGAISLRGSALTLSSSGNVASNTYGSGNAGAIDVSVEGGPIKMRGSIESSTSGSGAGGNITITAGSLEMFGLSRIESEAKELSSAKPGFVKVTTTGAVMLRQYADISTTARGNPEPGVQPPKSGVDINAGSLTLDEGSTVQANAFGDANAGVVKVTSRGPIVISNNSSILTEKENGGGGAISLAGSALTLASGGDVRSNTYGDGDAGSIDITVTGPLNIVDRGSSIQSSTRGQAGMIGKGAGGTITIAAGSLEIRGDSSSNIATGIGSEASARSTGRPGNIRVSISGPAHLRDGAVISTTNDGKPAPDSAQAPSGIVLLAESISMDNNAEIRANATGNANAGRIEVGSRGGPITLQDESSITTEASNGNGGPVVVSAEGMLLLRDAQITTSVTGSTNGNGGDITITAPIVIMRSGFIQANTEAPRASGGDVTVSTRLLLPDGGNLREGGNAIESFRSGVAGYNVIQAAAPDGVKGELNVSRPALNVAGALAALSTPRIGLGQLTADFCEVATDSSLSVMTRGALYPWFSAPMSWTSRPPPETSAAPSTRRAVP